MPTLDATLGGASSNAYDTVANATIYFDERLQSTPWSGEDAADQARALIMATRRIDRCVFEGERVSTGQALKWPRIGATDDDGYEYASDSIPDVVKYAMYEQALVYLVADDASTDPVADSGLRPFRRVKVAVIEAEMWGDYLGDELSEAALGWLRPVLVNRSNSGQLLRA